MKQAHHSLASFHGFHMTFYDLIHIFDRPCSAAAGSVDFMLRV